MRNPTYQDTSSPATRRPRPAAGANSESSAAPIEYSAPIATPRSNRTTNSCHGSVTTACRSPSTTNTAMSMLNSVRRPIRSDSRPATGAPTKIPMSVDAAMRPDHSGVSPRSWVMSTSTTLMTPRS